MISSNFYVLDICSFLHFYVLDISSPFLCVFLDGYAIDNNFKCDINQIKKCYLHTLKI